MNKIRNHWKPAFFCAFLLWIGTVVMFLYSILDQGVTHTYMQEGYADCEAHRDFLSAEAAHRLTKSQIESTPRDRSEPRVEVRYAEDDTYRASRFGASQTPYF